MLYHAAQVKALPGRPKTDRLDSVWLARITERGALAVQLRAAGGHPPAAHPYPLPPAADPGPHRGEAAVEKLLEDGAPEAVQRDHRHPRGLRPGHAGAPSSPGSATRSRLAQLAAARMRGKIAQLEEALDCSFFTAEHAFVLADDAGRHRPAHRPDRELTARIERAVPSRTSSRSASSTPCPARDHHRPGRHRRDRRGHDRLPHRRAPGLLGQMVPPGQPSPAASARARTPPAAATPTSAPPSARPAWAPAAPRPSSARNTGGCASACPRRKPSSRPATPRHHHALLSDPAASYHDLGPGYYDQRARTRRRARSHLRSLERLGYKVTIEPLTPDTDPALPPTS